MCITRFAPEAWLRCVSQGLVPRLGPKVWSQGLVPRLGPKVWSRGLVPRLGPIVLFQGLVKRFSNIIIFVVILHFCFSKVIQRGINLHLYI